MRRLPQHIGLLLLIYLCFISLGLPDGILGAAWPAIRMDMQQPLAAVGLMSVTMTVCSAISSLSAATLTRHWGTGPIVATSGLMTALALLAAVTGCNTVAGVGQDLRNAGSAIERAAQ